MKVSLHKCGNFGCLEAPVMWMTPIINNEFLDLVPLVGFCGKHRKIIQEPSIKKLFKEVSASEALVIGINNSVFSNGYKCEKHDCMKLPVRWTSPKDREKNRYFPTVIGFCEDHQLKINQLTDKFYREITPSEAEIIRVMGV